ncbi:hypothetical protein BV20DRAFT_234030 [Pilatotrama ljubarskyi]|nr:hypothetical protein BV20DRAFT_234030 [Pilatotrama ljubarskyi]
MRCRYLLGQACCPWTHMAGAVLPGARPMPPDTRTSSRPYSQPFRLRQRRSPMTSRQRGKSSLPPLLRSFAAPSVPPSRRYRLCG